MSRHLELWYLRGVLGVSNCSRLCWAWVRIPFLDFCCLLWILMAVGSLVESASAGPWVTEMTRDGLGVEAERG